MTDAPTTNADQFHAATAGKPKIIVFWDEENQRVMLAPDPYFKNLDFVSTLLRGASERASHQQKVLEMQAARQAEMQRQQDEQLRRQLMGTMMDRMGHYITVWSDKSWAVHRKEEAEAAEREGRLRPNQDGTPGAEWFVSIGPTRLMPSHTHDLACVLRILESVRDRYRDKPHLAPRKHSISVDECIREVQAIGTSIP